MRLTRGVAAVALLAVAACERADLTSPFPSGPDPVVLFDGAALVDIDVAGYYDARICAVGTDGAVLCHQLPEYGSSPQTFTLGRPAQSVAIDQLSACALDDTGQAWCWGENWWGNLGDGTTLPRERPVAMRAPAFEQIDVGYASTCGVTADGDLYCAGNFPQYAAFCDVCMVTHSTPTQLTTGFQVEDIRVGADFLCGIAADGTVHCWGNAFNGQLGRPIDATTTLVDLPAAAVAIEVSAGHVCATLTNQETWCWGAGWTGQLGTGRQVDVAAPAAVETNVALQQVALGEGATCALGPDGAPWCWGNNQTRIALTRVAAYASPQRVDRIPLLIGIATGNALACGIRQDQTGICWGATRQPVY